MTATAIRQRYIGPSVDGKPISGLIIRPKEFGQDRQPITYLIQTDPVGTGKSGLALAPAEAVLEHLAGLELLRSMEADSE